MTDSQEAVYERNLISWNELLSYFNDALDDLPILIAFNKQDLPDKFPSVKFLKEIKFNEFNNFNTRYTIAINGEGILECFEDILQMILKKYYEHKLISRTN